MIIELFGPPGAGKTTFAAALTSRLQRGGYCAELWLSSRPAERTAEAEANAAKSVFAQNPVMDRLVRPTIGMLTRARRQIADPRDFTVALKLVQMFPQKNRLRSIREGQYIVRLSGAWFEVSQAGRIALFDQAFVQVVCSLALRSRTVDYNSIAAALDYVPPSDFVVRLDAPVEILKARLNDRRGRQGRIERLLELDVDTSLASVPLFDRLHQLLLERGRPVLCASSLDQRSLEENVEVVSERILASTRRGQRYRVMDSGISLPRHKGIGATNDCR